MNWHPLTAQKSKLSPTPLIFPAHPANCQFRADNQPEFMQNLGFVSDAGIPELYSFSGQVEPFLLAQTQQLPGDSTPSGVRRESQSLGMSGTPKR